MSFANMKRNRGGIEKLINAAEAAGGGSKSYQDDRIWKPTVDKVGNGYAVLRFLPAGENQELPFVRYWDHGFKGSTGKWYIERSLTSIGQDDPVGELNSKLWNSGIEADKEVARKQKRRLHYVSNVLVVSDPGNPSNEGKVFMFQYGKKIFDKIMDVVQPQFQDEKPIDPFNMWEGANFKLKIRQVEGYRNYDKSEFEGPSEIGTDEYCESIYNSMHDLSEYTDPKNYKSYAELKTKLESVLGTAGMMSMSDEMKLNVEAPARAMQEIPAQSITEIKDQSFDSVEITTSSPDGSSEEDPMSYFAKLAAEG